jgi:hypothetical protein
MVHTCVTMRRKLDENTMTPLLLEYRRRRRRKKNEMKKVHMYIAGRKGTENTRYIYFFSFRNDHYKMRHQL